MLDIGTQTRRQADPTLLKIRLFERMQAVTLAGENVLPIGAKTRAILAILALSDRRAVLRSQISELLWSRRPEELARASLRQDIHRLLDALSPLGVEVIDVQRHTLALKPALTSVDAERVLTANTRTIDSLLPENPVLLQELNGIDPAFDMWLAQQRERLFLHIQKVYENRLQEARDPEEMDREAQRLLLLNACNDSAWRARIRAAMLRGHDSLALDLGELAIRTFENETGYALSSATKDLIASLRCRISNEHPDAAGSGVVEVQEAPPAESHAAAVPAEIDPSAPAPLRPGHFITTLMILPFEGGGAGGNTALYEELRDVLELQLVRLGGIRIQPGFNVPSEPDAQTLQFCRAQGVEYLITGRLRLLEENGPTRLIVRVLDLRDSCSIVWGSYCNLDLRTGCPWRVEMANFAQTIKWELVLVEARQTIQLPQERLTAAECVSRAFLLLSQRDITVFPLVESLLKEARQRDPQHTVLPITEAMLVYSRVINDWSEAGDKLFAHLANVTRMAPSGRPAISSLQAAIAFSLLLNPATQRQGQAIYIGLLNQEQDELLCSALAFRCCRIMHAVLSGDIAQAQAEVEQVYALPARSALHRFFDPFFQFVRVFGSNRRVVIEDGRMSSALYPRFPGNLVPYLIALVLEGEDEAEIRSVRDHMLRLQPRLTVERLVARFACFPDEYRAVMSGALEKAGLPQN